MSESHKNQKFSKEPCLNRPDRLVVRGMYLGGPFRVGIDRLTSVKPTYLSLGVSTEQAKADFDQASTPLREAIDGGSTDAGLSVDDLGKTNKPVRTFQVSVNGSLFPGLYRSDLTLSTSDCSEKIPVTIRISAHWIWIITFMLLGLLSLGIGQFLTGEHILAEKRRDVIELRQTFHELREQNPAAFPRHKLTCSIDDSLTTALRILRKPRPMGLKDWRIERAESYKAAAADAIQEIRKGLANKAPGQVELDSLERRWNDLLKRLDEVEQLLIKNDVVTSVSTRPIVAAAAELDARRIKQFIVPVTLAIRDGFAMQVERAKLAYTAGQGDRAQRLAMQVELWLQRAAALLEKRVDLVLLWRAILSSVMGIENLVRDGLNDPVFPEQARLKMSEKLDQAIVIIKERPTHEGFRDAHLLLQETLTGMLAARSTHLIKNYQSAADKIKAETSLAAIEQVFANASKDDSLEIKQTVLMVLKLWDSVAAGFVDSDRRQTTQALIEKNRQQILSGNLSATSDVFRQLTTNWSDDQRERMIQAKNKMFTPYCKKDLVVLWQEFVITSIALTLLQPNPMVAGVEEELDRIRFRLEKTPTGAECLNYIIDLHEKLLRVGNKLFNAALMVANIRPQDRLAAALRSESEESIVLAERLMREPWPIHVAPRTPADERYTDRNLVLEIGNINSAWGPGTIIQIDFGDGSPALTKNAEEVRKAGVISHRYPDSGNFRFRVTALDKEPDTSMGDDTYEILGNGEAALVIDPSPVSTATQLAAMFLNMRFLLAVIVALLIQGWRLTEERPFGSLGRDYIEAFAIGAGSNAGMEGVVALLQTVST